MLSMQNRVRPVHCYISIYVSVFYYHVENWVVLVYVCTYTCSLAGELLSLNLNGCEMVIMGYPSLFLCCMKQCKCVDENKLCHLLLLC
jgi:hypothetical protein